jgi:PTS system fructose-specific IIC component
MLRSLLTTLIIPLVGVGAVCYLMFYVVGAPLAALNAALTNFLAGLGQGSKILLGIVQGCMLAFDMGGTVNKIAYAFAVGMLSGATDPASELCMPMGANFVACCTPPLGIALAVLIGNALGKKKFTAEERSTGSVAGCFVGAACMITEFAIPYAVADPFRVIPSLMVGSALGAVLAYIMNVGIIAPHGGVFVIFFACSNIIGYFIALLAGSAATAACLLALKKDVEDEEIEEDEDGWA